MSRQVTLFGKAVKKQPFFKTPIKHQYGSCNTIHDVTMTHGPALIEFVPYVLGCVSINNILLRTGGGGGGVVGGWVRKNLKLLRIGKNFR